MLTAKQTRFVAEFCVDLNATQAAIRSGYSKKTATEIGAQLLAKPHVRAAIEAAKGERIDRTNVDADYVLSRLFEEAEADLADLFTDTNDLKPVEEWPEIWRTGLVAGLDIEALYEGHGKDRIQVGQTKKLRLSDRLRRIELIGKHIGVNAFQETTRRDGSAGLGDRLNRALAHSKEQRHTEPKVADASTPILPT